MRSDEARDMPSRALRKAGHSLENPPTEQILESARHLDQLSVDETLALIHCEDGEAWKAVGRVIPQISEAVDVLSCVVGGGGRWFNVGAGTSGRLGVLDASEIPPTFGMPHHAVQALIAGGDRALRRAVEGAEDDDAAARSELQERGLTLGDAVVAISASGTTPFAIGALEAAADCNARSISITCVGDSPLAEMAEISIVPVTGSEVVTGSTRMKAGLAQKMVLHMLSTTVMVQLGRVEGSLMTNISPVSRKLRSRSRRILMQLSGLGADDAQALLDRHAGDLSTALDEFRS
jgi:N-acetylmuramic acid 6-phosphate etherase